MSTSLVMTKSHLIVAGQAQKRSQVATKIIKKTLGISSAQDAENLAHPDLFILKPTNTIGIDLVRSLQKSLALKPYLAPVKIAFIPQAEKLTVPAQNALLKTLEEPPAKTLLILMAPNKEALLPTIVSRCQITQLTQEPQVEIDPRLISQYFDLLTSILNSGVGERLELALKLFQRPKALEASHYLLYLWRESLLSKTGAKKKPLQKEFKTLSLDQITLAVKNTETVRQMLEANVNPRLAIENLFLSYPFLTPPR